MPEENVLDITLEDYILNWFNVGLAKRGSNARTAIAELYATKAADKTWTSECFSEDMIFDEVTPTTLPIFQIRMMEFYRLQGYWINEPASLVFPKGRPMSGGAANGFKLRATSELDVVELTAVLLPNRQIRVVVASAPTA